MRTGCVAKLHFDSGMRGLKLLEDVKHVIVGAADKAVTAHLAGIEGGERLTCLLAGTWT